MKKKQEWGLHSRKIFCYNFYQMVGKECILYRQKDIERVFSHH